MINLETYCNFPDELHQISECQLPDSQIKAHIHEFVQI